MQSATQTEPVDETLESGFASLREFVLFRCERFWDNMALSLSRCTISDSLLSSLREPLMHNHHDSAISRDFIYPPPRHEEEPSKGAFAHSHRLLWHFKLQDRIL